MKKRKLKRRLRVQEQINKAQASKIASLKAMAKVLNTTVTTQRATLVRQGKERDYFESEVVVLRGEKVEAVSDAARYKDDYLGACVQLLGVYCAAMGIDPEEFQGPTSEDIVADVRNMRSKWLDDTSKTAATKEVS